MWFWYGIMQNNMSIKSHHLLLSVQLETCYDGVIIGESVSQINVLTHGHCSTITFHNLTNTSIM